MTPSLPEQPPLPPFTNSPEEQARKAARAARARRRRWRRVLVWGGLGTLWIAAICGVLALASGLGSRFILGPDVSQQAGTLGPGGQTRFSDPLTTLDSYWSTSYAYCAFRDGAYHITPTGSDQVQICYGNIGRFQDLDVQVNPTLVAGPSDASYGIVFRAIDPGDAYLFEVFANGGARFDALTAGVITPISNSISNSISSPSTLTAPVANATSSTSAAATMRVVAHGSSLMGYLNDILVAATTDARFTQGGVGLAAGGTGTDVAFTNFLLQPA